ncbi:MAG: hypothetical protein M0Q92_05690 [Methanoregula sp.]|nr:hypothetical protein [Methanoregula sp.]
MIRSFLEFFMPASEAVVLAANAPVMSIMAMFLLSLIGALLMAYEMHTRSLPWKYALALIVIFCVTVLSMVLLIVLPVTEILAMPRGDTVILFAIAFVFGMALVPLGVSCLLHALIQSGTDCPDLRPIRSWTTALGTVSLVIAFFLVWYWFTYLLPSSRTGNDWGWDFLLLFILGAFLCAVYLLLAMPAIGILLIRLGIQYRKTLPITVEVRPETGTPEIKSPGPIVTREPFRMTPKIKWAVTILAILAALVFGFFAWGMFFDTTPCKSWARTTSSAPFGSIGGFTSAEYKGQLWLIGGSKDPNPYGIAWHTDDGITWTRESSPEMVPQRMGATSAVFRDAFWVIGGMTESSASLHNDIWYSSNGITWSAIQPAAQFSPRSGHSTVVFDDRIWVIGGNIKAWDEEFTNDIWYSTDGFSWKQATPSAEFSPRSGHSSFVYDNKMWVIGGRDSTGYISDVWNSADGIHWTQVTASSAFEKNTIYKAVVFDNRMWVIQNGFVFYEDEPWRTETTEGIWYSTDGASWKKLMSSPEFFREDYSGGPPHAVVFDNRLWVLQWHNSDTGIWYCGDKE